MLRANRRHPPVTPLPLVAALLCFACTSGDETTTDGAMTTTTTEGASTSAAGSGSAATVTSSASEVHGTDAPTTGAIEPSCDDGEINQGESDVDCGGPSCAPCPGGSACADDRDCEDGSCVGNTCVAPACDDGAMNGGETDVDCGGSSCEPCADNLGCLADDDCHSGVCTGSFCAAPSCGDGVLNGDETDLDCGGPCDGCEQAEQCVLDEDCLSLLCVEGACAPADCQTDADCSAFTTKCAAGVCTPGKTCAAQPTNEGGPCDDDDKCTTDDLCSEGACAGAPVDCTMLTDGCNVGVCDPDDGLCAAEPANEGNPCDDGDACTADELCQAGACTNGQGYVFHEDFADNSQGWTLETEWELGPAVEGCGDPATDHTPTDDNGVAGVVLGGCATTQQHGYYCATSPVIDTTQLDAVWLTYWRDLYSDYAPYMKNKIEVFNGNTWILVFETLGAPAINDSEWSEYHYELTSYSNATLQVRWCHTVGSGGAFLRGSWTIDDVTVGPTQCTP